MGTSQASGSSEGAAGNNSTASGAAGGASGSGGAENTGGNTTPPNNSTLLQENSNNSLNVGCILDSVRVTQSDAVVNQALGKDDGMLPIVKGGAGAGLRYKDALMFQKCFMYVS